MNIHPQEQVQYFILLAEILEPSSHSTLQLMH